MPRKKTTKATSASKKVLPAKKKVTAQKSENEMSQVNSVDSLRTNLKNPRLWVGLAVVLLIVILFACKGLFVAAVVNGEPISRLSVVQQLEAQNGKDALDSLISETLIKQEASKEHVSVSQSEVNAAEQQISNTLKSQGMTLDQALSSRGMTKQQLENQIVVQQMVTKMVGKNITVSDQQVQDYITANKDSLPQGLSDDQLKAQVKQQLLQQALQNKTQSFVADLQKKASIQYFVSY